MASQADILRQAGFTGPQLQMARAIMLAESGGRATAHNPNAGTGDNSYGLFQINMLGGMGPARRRQFGLSSNEALFDPLTNAKVAFQMSKGGTDWSAWSTYKRGDYKKFLGVNPKQAAKFDGGVPLTGKGIDTPASVGRVGQERLVSSLLSSLGQFSKTGQVGQLDFSQIADRALDEVQVMRGGAKASFVADTNAGTVQDPAGLITEAKRWLGTPYSWGGGSTKGPTKGFGRGAGTTGFDCSSFIQYLNAKRGVSVARVTYDQWRQGAPVSAQGLQPGDAVFFHPGKRGPEHVGMYIGNGQYIHAPKTGDVVKISNLADRSDFMGGRRYGRR